jgi:3-keto-disaccharide hydrolase
LEQLMNYLRLTPLLLCLGLALFWKLPASTAGGEAPPGFVSLFNGKDFTGWTVPAGDNGHWKVLDGVIDYDAASEAPGDKNLWTEKAYRDFTLRLDWRIKETPYVNPRVPIIKPDGTHKRDAQGKEIQISVPDSDSGVFLRGTGKSQVNIWCWPVGSGEVYGYRMDRAMPAEVRAGVTPKVNADHDIGQWNTFEITVREDRLTVGLNGHTVITNAQLPGLPPEGRIGLQHHGGKRDGKWTSPPALVQFRNISIKEL